MKYFEDGHRRVGKIFPRILFFRNKKNEEKNWTPGQGLSKKNEEDARG